MTTPIAIFQRNYRAGSHIFYTFGDGSSNGSLSTFANQTPIQTLTVVQGNVGIGTTQPMKLLDIKGDVQMDGTVTLNNIVLTNGGSITGSSFTATQIENDLIRGSYLIGDNYNGSVATTWSVDADSAAVANKVVVRDASGNFSAGSITADLNGTATQVSQDLSRGTYLIGNNYNGSVATTWSVDASSAATANKVVVRDASGNFSASTITATLNGTATKVSQDLSRGTYLIGNNYNGSVATTWSVDASSANSANKVVVRDASGNFSASTITATLNGTATQVSSTLTRGAYLTGNNFTGASATTWAVDADTAASANKIVARDALGRIFAANVGIGTGVVKLGNQLEVLGPIQTMSSLNVSQNLLSSFMLTSRLFTNNITPLAGGPIIQMNGNVGIGTTTVVGTGIHRLQVQGSSCLVGNVGIGTTAPNYSMHVLGDLNYTGTLYQNGVAFSGGGSSQTLVRGTYLIGDNYNGSVATTWSVDASSAATANKVVVRDASGNFSAGTITATLNGTATQVSSTLTRGSYLTGNNFTGASATTWAVDADTAASANKIVARDALGKIFAANVGIGTGVVQSPNQLEVLGTTQTTSLNVSAVISGLVSCTTPDISVNTIFPYVGNDFQMSANVGIGTTTVLGTHRLQLQGTSALLGNVGIGTTAPNYAMHVIGDLNYTGTLYQNGAAFSGGSSQWTTNGTSIYYNSGNVGVGTTTPLQSLHVQSKAMFVGQNTSNQVYRFTNSIPSPPSVDGFINGVSITALNKRTRTSYAAANNCVSTWTTRTSAADNQWQSICWAPELSLFCAVASGTGTSNRVMTSPDGVTWTTRASAADNEWQSICWAPELSLFCAVSGTGTGNRVMTSTDGVTWTTRTSAANNNWASICWAPELSLFCAVSLDGTGNRIMTSPDGFTWTTRTSAADNQWQSICWAPELSLFCAVARTGTGNRVMTSPDGINWTTRTSAQNNAWKAICWAPELSLFCAVTDNFGSLDTPGTPVMISTNGITWTTPASITNQWRSICWAPELCLLCAVASGIGLNIMTSPDGTTWTSRITGTTNDWKSICWAPELSLFCAVSSSGTGNRVMTSAIGMPNAKSVVKALPSQMMVDATGNVGIGTTTPMYKMDVIGDINYTGNLRQNGNLTANPWTTSGNDIYYNGGNNVGIGTTILNYPPAQLIVSSAIKTTSISITSNLTSYFCIVPTMVVNNIIPFSGNVIQMPANVGIGTTTPNNNRLQVQGATTLMGNVGIGVAFANYAMHVVGDINYTGNLYQNGTLVGGGGEGAATSGVNEFTSTTTWTLPTSASTFIISMWGGGGGGGGGARQATTTTAVSGGGGGGAGASLQLILYRSLLGAATTFTITVGAGGNGGVAQTTSGSAGNNGSVGTETTLVFDNGSSITISCPPGNGGTGGSATGAAVSGGTGGAHPSARSRHLYNLRSNGTNGGNGSGTGQNATAQTLVLQATGGGGGGGVSTANVLNPGGGGGSIGTLSNSDNSGGAGYGGAAQNGPPGGNSTAYNATGGPGGGGGGASGASSGAPYVGAVGGLGGGGGGGGGGGRLGGGAGGKGGDGFVRISWF